MVATYNQYKTLFKNQTTDAISEVFDLQYDEILEYDNNNQPYVANKPNGQTGYLKSFALALSGVLVGQPYTDGGRGQFSSVEGGGQPHNNMQPSLVSAMFIYAGVSI